MIQAEAGGRGRARHRWRSSSASDPRADRDRRAQSAAAAARAAARRRSTPRPIPSPLEQNAVVEQAQAQLRALERSYFPRFYLQGSAYARGTGAETNGAHPGRRQRPGAQRPELRPRLQRDLSRCWTSPRSARARPRNRPPSARRRPAPQQIATDLRAQWNVAVANSAGRAARRRQHAGAGVRRARRRRSRPPPATSPASATSTRSPKRSGCSRKPKSTTRWPGSASGAACSAVAAAAGDIQPFLAEARATVKTASRLGRALQPAPSPSSSPCIAVALCRGPAPLQAHARRHLPAGRRSRHLRRPALRRHGPGADGRLPHVLLRVSLPLHHRHRSRRKQEHSGRRADEAGLPRGHRHEPGDGARPSAT